jgi:hypothetical protein
MMFGKRYRIEQADIKQLVKESGGCIATDRITVDGAPVGYMYRDEPEFPLDSGWRFMAGDEDEDYMDDESQSGIYDVNTIANYDPSIVPYLQMPLGIALERVASGEFRAVEE